jgi:hypothetical protein
MLAYIGRHVLPGANQRHQGVLVSTGLPGPLLRTLLPLSKAQALFNRLTYDFTLYYIRKRVKAANWARVFSTSTLYTSSEALVQLL